jgi:hypothetical protein
MEFFFFLNEIIRSKEKINVLRYVYAYLGSLLFHDNSHVCIQCVHIRRGLRNVTVTMWVGAHKRKPHSELVHSVPRQLDLHSEH